MKDKSKKNQMKIIYFFLNPSFYFYFFQETHIALINDSIINFPMTDRN